MDSDTWPDARAIEEEAARKAEQDDAIRKREMQPLEPIMIEYEHADVGVLYV